MFRKQFDFIIVIKQCMDATEKSIFQISHKWSLQIEIVWNAIYIGCKWLRNRLQVRSVNCSIAKSLQKVYSIKTLIIWKIFITESSSTTIQFKKYIFCLLHYDYDVLWGEMRSRVYLWFIKRCRHGKKYFHPALKSIYIVLLSSNYVYRYTMKLVFTTRLY